MTGDEGRLVGREKEHAVRDLVGLSHAVERAHRATRLHAFLVRHTVRVARLRRISTIARRLDRAWADAVDPYAGAVIDRYLSRQIDDRRLGRTIRRVVLAGEDAETRRRVHDVSIALREKVRQRGTDAVEHALKVGVHDEIP